jgi:hypothetical protein
MKGIENLNPPVRSAEEARELGRRGGKASGKARREKKLMSQIYASFLAEKHKVKIEGAEKEVTGEQYLAAVMNKVFGAGGAPAVSLMKEIREATEGAKVHLDGFVGAGVLRISEKMTLKEWAAAAKAQQEAIMGAGKHE